MDTQEYSDHDALITQFINITGADESIAKNALEAFNWNVEMAINMFVDSNLSSTTSASDVPLPDPVASDNDVANDDVRPPIPPVRQVLIEDYPGVSYNFRRNTSFDAFRNFEQETRWQEQQIRDDTQSQSTSSSSTSTADNKRQTLEDLFRPPLDLIFRGNFEMAKYEGQRLNKWLMVNIQNPQEFACQVLNRDVWSNHAVKSIISEHFIFWQSYHDNTEGQKYMNFYNVSTFPYVSIVDPRTGEKMTCWNEVDIMTFCDSITHFLNEHPSPAGKESSSSTNVDNFEKTLYDESEELQIKAAIQASLQELSTKAEQNSNDSASDLDDPVAPKDNTNVEFSKDTWQNYLGSDDSPKIEIVIRYPDGNRVNAIFPSTSKMKALFLYVAEHGYNMNEYDLITNFPKKNLSTCGDDTTLENAGIHSRDTLYVQVKN